MSFNGRALSVVVSSMSVERPLLHVIDTLTDIDGWRIVGVVPGMSSEASMMSGRPSPLHERASLPNVIEPLQESVDAFPDDNRRLPESIDRGMKIRSPPGLVEA
jgi:hypothetical protein